MFEWFQFKKNMVTRRRKRKTNDNDVDDDEFEIIRLKYSVVKNT